MISAVVRLAIDLGIHAHETWLLHGAEEAFYRTPPRLWLKAASVVTIDLHFVNLTFGVPKQALRPIELALNIAAVFFKARRSCNVSQILQQLKWLLIDKRL